MKAMSNRYESKKQERLHFFKLTIIRGIDMFPRKQSQDVFIECLKF